MVCECLSIIFNASEFFNTDWPRWVTLIPSKIHSFSYEICSKCVSQTWKMVWTIDKFLIRKSWIAIYFNVLILFWVHFISKGHHQSDVKPKLPNDALSKKKSYYMEEALSKTSKYMAQRAQLRRFFTSTFHYLFDFCFCFCSH